MLRSVRDQALGQPGKHLRNVAVRDEAGSHDDPLRLHRLTGGEQELEVVAGSPDRGDVSRLQIRDELPLERQAVLRERVDWDRSAVVAVRPAGFPAEALERECFTRRRDA